jgi:hypothetical protein
VREKHGLLLLLTYEIETSSIAEPPSRTRSGTNDITGVERVQGKNR